MLCCHHPVEYRRQATRPRCTTLDDETKKGVRVEIRRAILVAAACLLLTGCGAANTGIEEPSRIETPAFATPNQGRSLSSVGFTNGAASLVWLPSGTRLTYTADQPNLLIVTGDSSQADQVEDYLRQTLPGLGWRITAESDGGLLFDQGEWHGAYALGQDSWALTVRND